jgi:hypothetical protein
LLDKRLSQVSQRKAAAREVDCVVQLYNSSFAGWNITHFHPMSRLTKPFEIAEGAPTLGEARKLG